MAKRIVVETRSEDTNNTGWTLQLELVNCGRCKACGRGGYPHGPYWYAYHRPRGRLYGKLAGTKSIYIGKRLPMFEHGRTYTAAELNAAAKMARGAERELHKARKEKSDGTRTPPGNPTLGFIEPGRGVRPKREAAPPRPAHTKGRGRPAAAKKPAAAGRARKARPSAQTRRASKKANPKASKHAGRRHGGAK